MNRFAALENLDEEEAPPIPSKKTRAPKKVSKAEETRAHSQPSPDETPLPCSDQKATSVAPVSFDAFRTKKGSKWADEDHDDDVRPTTEVTSAATPVKEVEQKETEATTGPWTTKRAKKKSPAAAPEKPPTCCRCGVNEAEKRSDGKRYWLYCTICFADKGPKCGNGDCIALTSLRTKIPNSFHEYCDACRTAFKEKDK